jgi:four helix bundle protein
MSMPEKKSILKEKSFAFAVRCVNLNKHLREEKGEFIMSKQLLRSGTSIGSNIREAQNAESRNDFIHKLGIAQKETDETIYWLELLKETKYISLSEFNSIYKDAEEILKMLKSSIITAKTREKSNKA